MYPRYLSGPSGALFVTVYLPTGGQTSDSWILHLPAFAEEMNKSRHVITAQARELARKGYAVIVPDLFGTGESAGDFGEASWECWKQDIHFLISWAKRQGATQVTLWGMRLGALLAVEIAKESPGKCDRLLLWQPVISGQQAMTQFLRLRMAAGLMGGGGESVSSLRERLAAGETLEVAGYRLSPSLYSQASACTIDETALTERTGFPIDWLEVTQSEKGLSPIARRVTDAWSESSLAVAVQTVPGEPFWTTQELADAPDLIEKTTAIFADVATSAHQQTPEESHSDMELESPHVFNCRDKALVGTLHRAHADGSRAVLVVVGGPQYRIGSHRQFVMLARSLAAAGTPVFRFDYRGMGDSEGQYRGFEGIGEDIRSAIDTLMREAPGVREVVIWGLCDGATAAAFYAVDDPRVTGLVLLNPWVRSEQGEARTLLRHYYLQRLLSKGFWQKLLSGKVEIAKSLDSLGANVSSATREQTGNENTSAPIGNLRARLEQNLQRFPGQVLFILSENDLTAAEFRDAVKASKGFRRLVKQARFQWREVAEADHTFSRKSWRDQVAQITAQWIKEW